MKVVVDPLSDLSIAKNAVMQPIRQIADKIGLSEDALELYGKYKAKIDPTKVSIKSKLGKIVLVTAISPTAAGEGKSTVTVGLADAMQKIGQSVLVALREPSLGPVMGVKGGATGGGYAQVLPMDDINLHFTGDLHAITTANNALAAIIDNHIYQGNELNIDPRRIVWKRVLDLNDRALRHITIGLGGPGQGVPREEGFDITVASEIMAILCLAKDLADLKERLARVVIGYTYAKEPINVRDLEVEGALTLLLKEAIKPNLVQTIEGTPALIHGGPFANIAHGCNSIIATKTAANLADIVITEAGFGADLGAEKFMHIKSRQAGFSPDAVVIVATIRALKMHGGKAKDTLKEEDVEALLKGTSNLEKHVETIRAFGVEPIIALNKFITDSEAETEALLSWCQDKSIAIALTEVWGKGGSGGVDLANLVLKELEKPSNFAPLYEITDSIEDKVRTIVQKVYGGKDVVFTDVAKKQINQIKTYGWDALPICMAKTQYSLSDQPKLLGRPTGFIVTVREVIPKLGAGFLVCLTGDIMTMPGLPKKPAALKMDVTEDGQALGLF